MKIGVSEHEPETRGLWYPVSFRYLVKRLGWRDRRFQALVGCWFLFTVACVASGVITDAYGWVGFALPFLGKSRFITLYPPVYLCQFVLFLLGFEWAMIPSFLATFLVCLKDGIPLPWSGLIGMGDSLGLAVFALVYRSANLRVDLRSWSSVGGFLVTTLAAAIAASTGAFAWSAVTHLDAATTYFEWQGWLLGSTVGVVFIVMPAMFLTMRRWQAFRGRRFPVAPRRPSSFLFYMTAIVAAGLVMAALLTQTSYMATIRLMEALKKGVPPEVGAAIRNGVASWQMSAWTAIGMVVVMMVVGFGHAYWWSERWRRQHEELVYAKREAEAASCIKSQFLATISHELRTPLNGILGMNQLLLESDLTEEQSEYLHMADDAGNQLLELVNNVLDLSKIEAGRLDIVSSPFAVRDIVNEVARLLGAKMDSRKVELRVAIDEEVPAVVNGDESRIRQILLNLAGNAIKFTPSGWVLIEVKAEARRAPMWWEIRVQDTGIGIAPDVLNNLFQPFTQGDSSTTRRFGGTGLGLSISQRLARAMGGSIAAESELGVGSTFTLRLPLQAVIGARTGGDEIYAIFGNP